MAISDAQYEAWLADENQERCILVEAEYSGSNTEYISTFAFVSAPLDTPANIAYDEIIKAVPEIDSSIDGEVTIGKILVSNIDGVLDSWVTRAWRGWPLRVYLGDPVWDRDDFRLIVKGINGGISAPRQDEISFEIRDKRELLQEVVQTNLMAGGEPKPLSLGTVFNAEPVAAPIYRADRPALA